MSLNDHGWGNKPDGDKKGNGDQGPPDLDELWRDFNRRLSGMFGGKRGGGGNGGGFGGGEMPSLTPRQFGGGVGLLLGLVAVLWIASGFYIVDASQRGVVLQFGRYKETTDPGLRWRMPWPIQSHEVVNLSGVRTVEVGYRGSEKNKVLKEALMLTDDENIVSVQFAVQYLLKSPQDYIFKNRFPDEAVTQAAETAIREVVGKNKMDFVLYEGRDVIAANTTKLMQDILDRYETGIQIRAVTMQSTQPPEQVQAAFDDAVKAGQDRERQKNEGQAYANDVIPRAQGTAARLTEEASGYKSRIVATAQGDASRFKQILVEYARYPEVTRQRMYLETLQQIYSNTSKVMVDAKGQGNLLYLPLDKLMQAASVGVAAQAGPSEPAPASHAPSAPVSNEVPPQLEKAPPVGGSGDNRSRDSLRSRDRGIR
ncbi:FtsH protease activity modulator HflK [Denitratisoma oestradiolicum]|uniref:Protein HflK n=1 Tax=Denitratisoma oestradiolicum TaxID=311182 RepID=A0A6S6Y3H7_9PROT|nr:FtsH protease activity modulator HflK [Denitratisoma oestradiolicum]TWO78990.1 HflK protein [Denitratisoma oestradiolicum]CAB1369947.1 Protein HflK [Denitratisoma oestradiolicum]